MYTIGMLKDNQGLFDSPKLAVEIMNIHTEI